MLHAHYIPTICNDKAKKNTDKRVLAETHSISVIRIKQKQISKLQ